MKCDNVTIKTGNFAFRPIRLQVVYLIDVLRSLRARPRVTPPHRDEKDDMNTDEKRQKESEKALERRLVDEVKKMGGFALKLTSQFHRGMPDRLVLLPYHTIVFVELKSTGEKPRPLQEAAMNKLISLGFRCWVIDSSEKLDFFLERMGNRMVKMRKQIEAELSAYDKMNK